jgi:hypothetical protein
MATNEERINAAIVQLEGDSEILHDFMHNPNPETVTTESGVIPTIAKLVVDLSAQVVGVTTEAVTAASSAAASASTSASKATLADGRAAAAEASASNAESAASSSVSQVAAAVAASQSSAGSASSALTASQASAASATAASNSASAAVATIAPIKVKSDSIITPATSLPTKRDDGSDLHQLDTFRKLPEGKNFVYISGAWVADSSDTSLIESRLGAVETQVSQKLSVLANYATLRAYTGSATNVVLVARATPLDFAGGDWVRDDADTTSVDNDIVTLRDGLNRCWRRKYTGNINLKWAGAKLDKVTDDSAAFQKVVNYCATFTHWPSVEITGPCLIANSVMVDRLVDTTHSDWLIFASGPGAGLYASGNVTIFDSTIPVTIDPRSEGIKFINVHFESSSIFNEAYILSGKFLRVSHINCSYRLIRYCATTLYMQTHYFTKHNIRNVPSSFIACAGLYDVDISHGIIENNFTLIRCIDTARGVNGLRMISNVNEGGQAATIIATGMNAFLYIGNHVESNVAEDLSLWAGSLRNSSMSIDTNYVYNPLGAMIYHGPADQVSSKGNSVSGLLHENMVQVTSWTSIGDKCGTLSDKPASSSFGGIKTNGQLTLSDPVGAAQAGNMFQGIGAPGGAAGKAGDYYFRTDTPTVANQRIYTRLATVGWQALL